MYEGHEGPWAFEAHNLRDVDVGVDEPAPKALRVYEQSRDEPVQSNCSSACAASGEAILRPM